MNWLVFAVLTWFAMGLDLGLRNVLSLGDSAIAPRFTVVLLVFICIHAPPGAMMLAAILVGLLLDAVSTVPEAHTANPVMIIGPFSLGCMLAAYAILTVRSVMQRKSPFTLAVLVLVGSLLVEVVRLTLLTVRSFYDDLALEGAAASLGTGFGVAVYSAVLAVLLAPLLGAVRRPMRFQGQSSIGFVMHS